MLTTLILKEKVTLKVYIQESMLCFPIVLLLTPAFKCKVTILSDWLKSYWHLEKK